MQHLKKELRHLKIEAYERELAGYMQELYKKFQSWKNGNMSAGELSHHIHEYDSGPSRQLFHYYNSGAFFNPSC
ncbi:MAG: hypothetical protein U5R06_23240 [candidate division KSB1 bacterium]|nr:hypothetical protein [candidate division KSB1 bacterium]